MAFRSARATKRALLFGAAASLSLGGCTGGQIASTGTPLTPQERGPNIAIQVNVNVEQLAESDFEVQLKLDGSAGEGADTLFKFELLYCGVFRMVNIPQEQLHPVVMIECPRILFPFARQIVADAVRNGGFPPLYLDPVDFGALYMQRVAEQQGQASPPVA